MRLLEKIPEKDNVLYRMVFAFVMITATVICVLTTVFSVYFENILQTEKFNSAKKNLSQVSNIVQFRAEYANRLLYQIQQDWEIRKLFASSDYDSKEILSTIDRLDHLRRMIPNVYSIYVYDQEAGVVFNSSREVTEKSSRLDFFVDPNFIDIINNIDQYNMNAPIFRSVHLPSQANPDYHVNVYTYLIYDKYTSGKTSNILAINFDIGWIKEGLGYMQNQDMAVKDIRIVKKTGQIIYSPIKRELGTYVEDAEILQAISGDESGYIVTGEGKNQQLMTYAPSTHVGYTDWVVISTDNLGDIMQPIYRLKLSIYAASVLLFLASIVGSVFLSVRLYRPIKTRLSTIDELEAEQKKKIEMERQLYLKKLLFGNIDESDAALEETFQRLQIHFKPREEICLVLVSLDYYNSFIRRYGGEAIKKQEEVQKKILLGFQQYDADTICVAVREDAYGIVVHAQNSTNQSLPDALNDIFNHVNQELENTMQLTISMSVSQSADSVEVLPFLLSEVLNIQAYRYLLGFGTILTSEAITSKEALPYEYPKAIEKEILSNLFKGKKEETLKSFEAFLDIIRNYSVEEIKISFLQLAYAIKYYSQNTMAELSSILISYEQFTAKIQSLKTIQEVNQLFCHLFEEMIEKMEIQSKTKYDRLIEQVKQCVARDYAQFNFSINDAAEEAGMSAAYLGRLFKQVTGIAFTEYLTTYRLEEAVRLLLETDKTVNEIGEATGFVNSSYFYVVFKKNLQCTPNQYRKNREKG